MTYLFLSNGRMFVGPLRAGCGLRLLRLDKGAIYRCFSSVKYRNQSGLFQRDAAARVPALLGRLGRRTRDTALVRGLADNQRVNKSELRRLLSLARPERWKLLGAVCLLVVSSAVSMAVPFSLGKVIDTIYSSGDDTHSARTKLNNLCMILVGIFAVGALCNFGRIYLITTSGYRMTQALRIRVFSSILRQEQGWFDSRATGELINRLSADTQLVGHALSSNISDGLRSTLMVLAGSGMMSSLVSPLSKEDPNTRNKRRNRSSLPRDMRKPQKNPTQDIYTSPELALVGLAVVPPVAGVAVAYGRFIRKITKQVQDQLAAATNVAEERISNIRTVKTFGREYQEVDRYSHKVQDVLHLGYKESLARAVFYGLTGFSGNVIIISVLYYGGVMVSDQTITVGNLTSFLLYAAYIGISISGLTSFYSELNKSVGAASRLWELVDREPIIPVRGGIVPEACPQGQITFKSIKFSYPTRKESQILQDLELEISPGKTVAVVGPSGSGKSTLAALLLRLYDPAEGEVYLDGKDIKQLDPNWLRRNIGTVSQEPVLFSCSIRDNILYGADNPESVTEERLLQAAKEANVYEFVQSLPQGFDTVVGERGVLLSGGQKQRIAIARALLKDPRILVLDEATSALDAHSEYLVREALERAMHGRTVLTIAHRLSTVQNADTIAVLKGGKIVQAGPYSQLVTEEGAFKDLVQHQLFVELGGAT